MSIVDQDRPVREERPALPGSKEGSDPAAIEAVGEIKQASSNQSRPMHRLRAVRHEQDVSLRSMARRLGVDVSTVLQQEQEDSDLPLQILYQWQRALDVPVADLLVDPDVCLSAPVLERARMVKVMKTSMTLMEKVRTNSQRRLVTRLIDQLLEIMPELREVSAWHEVGQRRTLDELGRAIERSIPDDLLRRNQ